MSNKWHVPQKNSANELPAKYWKQKQVHVERPFFLKEKNARPRCHWFVTRVTRLPMTHRIKNESKNESNSTEGLCRGLQKLAIHRQLLVFLCQRNSEKNRESWEFCAARFSESWTILRRLLTQVRRRCAHLASNGTSIQVLSRSGKVTLTFET